MSDLSYDGNVRADRVQLVDLTGTPYAATGGGGGGGDASAANQTSQLAQETLTAAALGAPADALVATNAAGTISSKLRGVVKLLVDLIAKTPALGTAGSAATDVITVQGIASATAIPVTPTAGTTGPMKAEDAAAVDGDQGIAAYAVRRDTPVAGGNVSTAGDYLPLITDSRGHLWTAADGVQGAAMPTNSASMGVSDGTNLRAALGAANALNSTGAGLAVAQGVAQFDDVSPQTVTENQFGNLRMSAKGVAYSQIRDAAGNERGVNVSANNAMTVEGVAGGVAQPVTAGGYTVLSTATITRPGDTNAYTAKDAISSSTSAPAILTFASCARASGGSGYVTSARVVTNQAACVSAFRLHLYDATLTAVNDNAAQTVLEANWGSSIGYIDFPAMTSDGSDTAASQATDKPLPFVAAGTSLFGMLETVTGFTPANAQHFQIKLGIEQN